MDLRFKIFVVGVGEEIAHEELAQLPTDHSLSFSADNDDLLKAMLNDAADYGCTGKRKPMFYHRFLTPESELLQQKVKVMEHYHQKVIKFLSMLETKL